MVIDLGHSARTDSLSRHAKVHLNGKVRKGRGSANTNATSISESATDQSLIEQHEGPMAAINEASFTASQTSADFAVVAQNQPLIDPMLMQQEVSPIDPMLNQDPNHYQPHHEQAYPEHELQPGLAQPHYQWPAPYNNYAPPHDQHNMFIYSSDSHAPQMMTAGQNYVANGYDGSQHLQAQTYMNPG
jgi:hypothetical protein